MSRELKLDIRKYSLIVLDTKKPHQGRGNHDTGPLPPIETAPSMLGPSPDSCFCIHATVLHSPRNGFSPLLYHAASLAFA